MTSTPLTSPGELAVLRDEPGAYAPMASALALSTRRTAARSSDGQELHTGLGVREVARVRRDDPKEADREIADLRVTVGTRPARTFPYAPMDVGAEPGELVLDGPLHEDRVQQRIRGSDHGDVEADGVHQLDHLRALGDPGHHGRTDEVAAEGGDGVGRVARSCLSMVMSGREAAASLLGADLVDVVQVQEEDRVDLVLRGARGLRSRSGRWSGGGRRGRGRRRSGRLRGRRLGGARSPSPRPG